MHLSRRKLKGRPGRQSEVRRMIKRFCASKTSKNIIEIMNRARTKQHINEPIIQPSQFKLIFMEIREQSYLCILQDVKEKLCFFHNVLQPLSGPRYRLRQMRFATAIGSDHFLRTYDSPCPCPKGSIILN